MFDTEIRISPFRRYCARCIDTGIYGTVLSAVVVIILRCPTSSYISNVYNIFAAIATMIITLFLEPLLLSRFGTTPGKKLLGISLENVKGDYLTYEEAFKRTWGMIGAGQGYLIPIYSLYRGFKSYRTCSSGEQLEWDAQTNTILTLKDRKLWRIGAFIAVVILELLLGVGFLLYGDIPRNKGELTVEEFAENYNQYVRNSELSTLNKLDNNGEWIITESQGYSLEVALFDYPPFEVEYIIEDGEIIGFVVERVIEDEIFITNSDMNVLVLLMAAFGKAQSPYDWMGESWSMYMNEMSNAPFQDYEFSMDEITVCYDIEYSGYRADGTYLIGEEEEQAYCFTFQMLKETYSQLDQ